VGRKVGTGLGAVIYWDQQPFSAGFPAEWGRSRLLRL